MNFEVLKKNNLKKHIITGVVVVAIIAAIVINITRAKYVYTDKMPLINGTVNYSIPDLTIVAIYLDGSEVETLDESETYTLDTTQSICTYKDGSTIENLTLNYDSNTKAFSITPFTTKGTKCTLYFNSAPAITNASLAYNAITVNNTSNPN